MTLRCAIAFVCFWLLLPGFTSGATPTVMLYQVNNVLTMRLGDDVAPFAKYIKALEAEAAPFLEASGAPELFEIFVLIKPGDTGPFQRTRVWLVSNLSPAPGRDGLKKALEAVLPPPVDDGPVAFTLCYALHGAVMDPKAKPPLPEEWIEKAPKSAEPPAIPDGVIQYIWPD